MTRSISQPREFRAGQLIGGRYELRRHLGAGGYSTVFEAIDRRRNVLVALKVLKAGGGHDDPSALARLRQEASLLRQLDHPSIVKIYEFAQRDGLTYIAMELLAGASLAHALRRDGPWPTERVLALLPQLLEALRCAHAHKILHRDIKPENIILLAATERSSASLKLVDFGLAKAYDTRESGDSLAVTLVKTREGGFLGTPRYVSPEQALGDPVGPFTDLFSVGLVAAEWLTGQVRLSGDTHAEIMRKLVGPEPIEISDCPARWRPWLQRMLEKQPPERIQDPTQALALLRELVVEGRALQGGERELSFDPGRNSFVRSEEAFKTPDQPSEASSGPLELDLEHVARAERAAPTPPQWAARPLGFARGQHESLQQEAPPGAASRQLFQPPPDPTPQPDASGELDRWTVVVVCFIGATVAIALVLIYLLFFR